MHQQVNGSSNGVETVRHRMPAPEAFRLDTCMLDCFSDLNDAAQTIIGPCPLRVLLVTARFLPSIGGTEIHTYEIASRLIKAGHDVTVLTTDLSGKLPATEQVDGIRLLRVRAWPAKRDYYFAPGIYRTIMHGHWDIIHCQGYHTFVAPLTMLAAWRSRTPYLVTFHSGGHSSRLRKALRGMQRTLLRPLLARAEWLIGVSRWEADFFRERLNLPAERFVVIPNGSYLPSECHSDVRPDSTLIISVGRLERYKGHHRVLESLPRVAAECPDVRLRILGSGPYEATLRRITRSLGVDDRVEIGMIAGSDRRGMASILAGAKLVILLSDYESQSIAVMEALALGRPVLVADTSALHDLAAGGLVRATPLGSTADEVAAAVLNQLHQPLIPAKVDLPTWDACANDILALYRAVAERSLCAS
jgi:glycosyltransferase involved in cell wall biosynthesis